MALRLDLETQISIAGLTIAGKAAVTGDALASIDAQIPAGNPSATGLVTDVQAGPEVDIDVSGAVFSPGDVVDLWNNTTGVVHCGYLVTSAGTPTVVQAGESAPAIGDSVTIHKAHRINWSFDGDDAAAVIINASRRCGLSFIDGGGRALAVDLTGGWTWRAAQGLANPLAGDPILFVWVSNPHAAALHFQAVALYDNP